MIIYTDGACKENFRDNGVAEGTGGWAFIILEQIPGKDMHIAKKGCGQKIGTTNQEMEIRAVYEALKLVDGSPEIILYSDSAYVINCLKDKWYIKWRENGWLNNKRKPVENRDEWERMIELVEKYNVKFFHVRRNTTKFIQIVDNMAKQASKKGTIQEPLEQ
ncbi:MAG: ribonuclease H [Nanoarchaeota archaeon]